MTSFIANYKMSTASIKVELWNIDTILKNNDVIVINLALYQFKIVSVITNTDYITITVIEENYTLPTSS